MSTNNEYSFFNSVEKSFDKAAACVFTETLNKFPAIPKINKAIAKKVVEFTKPNTKSERGYKMEARMIIFLLPNLAVILPEIGMPTKVPMGKKNKKPPKAPSLNPSCILISGIRLAQLAKQIPVKKKKQDKNSILNEKFGINYTQICD